MSNTTALDVEEIMVPAKDAVREAFEFWYSDEGAWPKAVEKDEKGRYAIGGATAAWDAWKAGAKWQREQDALICERLPVRQYHHPLTDVENEREWARDAAGKECAAAIRTPPQPGAAQ